MSSLPLLLQIFISAIAITAAGVLLTHSSDRIAQETGWGRALVGGILLAGATSLPELFVDINAIRFNRPDLAAGDLLGSNLFNLLILATVDAFFRPERRAFSREFLHHTPSAALGIHLSALVGIGILASLPQAIGGVGIFTWLILILYLVGMRSAFYHPGPIQAAPESKEKFHPRALAVALFGFLVSTTIIAITAPYLVHAADAFADQSGLGHTFVGTTLVALSTSLPEWVATVSAYRMRAPDLALGNIFGSNAFNMLLFFPLDAFSEGPLFSSVRSIHALTALSIVAIGSMGLLAQVSKKRTRPRIWEPGASFIMVMSVAFLYLLYLKGKTP